MNPGSAQRFWPILAATALFLSAPLVTSADRLHLENGGYIDVNRWWIEGDTLIYETSGGTVGIPRNLILHIDAGKHRQPPARGGAVTQGSAVSVVDRGDHDLAEMRETLHRAHAALEKRDYELASSYYLSLIMEQPKLYVARVGYAMSEMALGRDGLALSAVLDGINLQPDRAELHGILGELRYRDDRLEDALRAWRAAFKLDPDDRWRDRIIEVERELQNNRHFDFTSSSHFNLLYDGSVDVGLARSMIDYLEDQYWVVSDAFRHSPLRPITVQLYPERQFREVTLAPEWVGGLYDGKIRVPLGGLSRLTPDAQRVLVHELTHAVVHSLSRGQSPRWLQEGLAQTMENKPLLDSQMVRIAERLGKMRPEKWSELPFSYETALSQTRYLRSRRGFDGLVQVVERLGAGDDADEALRRVYGQGYEEICKGWGRAVLAEHGR